MTDAPSRPSWSARGRRALVLLVLVVLVVLAVRAVSDIWLGRRMNWEIARLTERYGPPRGAGDGKVSPFASENRARLMNAAAARITLSDAHERFRHINEPRMPQMITAEQARDIADGNREAVQLAIRAARLRHSNWGFTPNLLDLGFLSKVLATAARLDTDAGRADAAVAAVMGGLAAAEAIGSWPEDVMLLFATRIAVEQEEALKDILSRADPSAPALAELAAVIHRPTANPARELLLGELSQSRRRWPRVERGWLLAGITDEWPPPGAWRRGVAWLFRPVIRFMALRDFADKARAVDAASLPRSQRARVVPPPSAPAPGLIDVGDAWTASLSRTAIAVALRRFRLDRGAYPDRLDALAPTYLETLPPDPFTGRPPEYARSGDGFELRTQLRAGSPDIAAWKLSR